jgi:succinate dehydrogenase/fumarate reductase flavoprotein subunit
MLALRYSSTYTRDMARGTRPILAGVGTLGAFLGVRQYSQRQLKNRVWENPPLPASGSSADVLIVGTGAAGLFAGLRAKHHGLNPIIVEKSDKVGGTSAYSGGVMWIPNNGLSDASDSKEEALTYMNNIIGDVGPASSQARRLAFLDNGPKMIQWMVEQGVKLRPVPGYPDYFPELPGGKPTGGRNVEPGLYNRNEIGNWGDMIAQEATRSPIPIFTREAVRVWRAKTSWDGWWTVTKILVFRYGWEKLMGRDPIALGQSLISQLLKRNLEQQVPILTNTALKDIIIEDGKIQGAILERDGKELIIKTNNIILAAGGFGRSKELRSKYQPQVGEALWTNAVPTDTGDALKLALKHRLATAMLWGGWWMPTFLEPSTRQNFWSLFERGLPHGLIVDSKAQRFANEAQSYNQLGNEILKHDSKLSGGAIPSTLIIDSNHRNRYLLTERYLPGYTPQSAIDSGLIIKADTIKDLAKQLKLDPATLEKTVERFNGFAEKGKDEDFHRGESAYDRYFGDHTSAYKKNPNLGTVAKAPFYALKVYPGDLGTKGGLLTDEYARALMEDGKVLEGLYAVGNSSASVMGNTYPGAGGTLGPAMAFSYIAMDHVSKQKAS